MFLKLQRYIFFLIGKGIISTQMTQILQMNADFFFLIYMFICVHPDNLRHLRAKKIL